LIFSLQLLAVSAEMIIFAEETERTNMTREEVLAKFEASRQRKREAAARLEKQLKEEYERQTGRQAKYFQVW